MCYLLNHISLVCERNHIHHTPTYKYFFRLSWEVDHDEVCGAGVEVDDDNLPTPENIPTPNEEVECYR